MDTKTKLRPAVNNKGPRPENSLAFIYLRVSTEGQENYSPETQLSACQTYADAKHLIVHDVIKETGSAWKAKNRPKYFHMIDRLVEEDVSNLIFYLPDRIARNLDDWIPLRNVGARLHDAVKNDSFNPLNPRDYKKTREFERALVNATESSDDTSKRVSDAWVTQAQRGRRPHRRALGYLIGPPVLVGKKWESTTIQDPERAPIIRLLFQHILTTGERNRSALRRKSKELGLRSPTGLVLGLQQVIDLLQNPIYCGEVWVKGTMYCKKGEHEPIVAPEEFAEVQAILGGKRPIMKGGKRSRYSDLITCDYCGCAVVLDPHPRTSKRTGETKTHLYYRCTGGRSEAWYQEHFHRPKCPLYYGPFWKEDELDRLFGMFIEALYVDPEVAEWVRGEIESDYRNLAALNDQERGALDHEARENEHTQGQLALRLAAATVPSVIKAYEGQIEHLAARNDEISRRLEELRTGAQAVSVEEIHDTLELSKSLKDNYLAATPEKRVKLNKLMFRTVRLARKNDLAQPVENDPALTLTPIYFDWNEPFKTLNEIGFIQGIAEAEAEWRERLATQKPAENKTWRAWRDSNPRPAA